MIQLLLLLLLWVFGHRLLPLRCVESRQTSSMTAMLCLSEHVLKTRRVTHN